MPRIVDWVKKGERRRLALSLVLLIFLSVWGTGAYASSCKQWVTVNDECSTNCYSHGSFCDIYECYASPPLYTSKTTRMIWQTWPAWIVTELGQKIIRKGVVCGDICTVATQQFQCPSCASTTKITAYGADKTVIAAGESVTFTWAFSGCVDTATVSVGGTVIQGTISPNGTATAVWNGTDADHQIEEPKEYTADITVLGECCGGDEKPITITVLPPPKLCPLRYKSGVHMATGALLQSELLFAAKGGSLPQAVTLSYDSLDPGVGPLGAKWSHSYDIVLTLNDDGSATLREGNSRTFYNFGNGGFVSQPGDHSRLEKKADGTYAITYQDGMKKMFAATGRITAMTDLNGNALAFRYDVSGKLTSVSDAAGRAIALAYDASGRLVTVTDPAGKDYAFAYSGILLESVTWPDGGTWHYAYDAKGFMLSKTDPLGNVTTYAYDANKRVTQGTDSSGTLSVAHSNTTAITKSTAFTDAGGGIWNYTFDSHRGILNKKTDPMGNSIVFVYDADGNVIQETTADGAVTSYRYNASGNMLSKTDALGKTTTYTYNGLGEVTSLTDPLGHTTSNVYDAAGRLVQTVDSLGAKKTYIYDGRGNLTGITDALNHTSTFTYNAQGNQTSSTDPTGATATFTYDAMGNMLTKKDPTGKITTFEYDGRYRLTRVTDPLGNATSYAYDSNGNRTSVTDANGNTTRYEYDVQGHAVKAVDALGNATAFTYGAAGCASCGGGSDKLTSVTDANSHTTIFQYDILGRLIKETDPLGHSTLYGYDSVGNLVTKTNADGATVKYSYDLEKRLTKISYPDGSAETYTYDATGRTLTATNPNIAYNYTYDPTGRVTTAAESRGYKIAYTYDLLGNRTSMTLQPGTADQLVTTYGYDAAGRLGAIRAKPGTFTYGYDNAGRRTSLSYPNGITTTYDYDGAGRLVSLKHGSVASLTYTYDKVGNRTSKTLSGAIERYLYDSAYRLLKATGKQTESFSYDAVGNRLTGPGAKDTGYQYDASNEMVQGRKYRYNYDENGNQITRILPGSSKKSWSQSWDYQNRLVKVDKRVETDSSSVMFTYDFRGRRIGKQSTTVSGGEGKTETHDYVYDDDDIILEVVRNGSSTTMTSFLHGMGVDDHLAMEEDGHFSYFHPDGLGSIIAITDEKGYVLQRYEYDSFGMRKPSPSLFKIGYTYTGRELDKETGLYYYRARYYDPMEGRFISKDPIGFEGDDNVLYSYVQNNPINLTDPQGLHTFPSPTSGETCIRTGTCHHTKKNFKLKVSVECKCQFKFGISYDGPVAKVTIFDSEGKETFSVEFENTVTLSLGPCDIKTTLMP